MAGGRPSGGIVDQASGSHHRRAENQAGRGDDGCAGPARKLSLRAVFVSGGGVRSDQIADQARLGCPAASRPTFDL